MIYRFLLKSFFISVGRVIQHPRMYNAIIILMASAIIQPVIGQKFSVWAADEFYLTDPDYFQGSNPENTTMNLSLFPQVSGELPTLRSENSLWRPDSVYEYDSDGYQAECIHRYYRYGQPQFQDSIISFFYNSYDIKLRKQEYQTFNADGKMTLYLLKDQDPWTSDTNLIDFTRKEYTYEGELLVHEKIRDEDLHSWDSNSDYYYFYDNDGRLILDSLFLYEEFAAFREYEYVDRDTLKYKYEKGSGYMRIIGYFFEKTDTSLLTTICESYSYEEDGVVADTITQWYSYKYYLETFDALGRTTSLSYSGEYPRFQIFYPGYRAEFNYTTNGMLSYEKYYNWEGSAEEGSYVESTRRSYEYDVNGNLKVFEQTFWGARLKSWETEIKREYFYSTLTVIKDILDSKKSNLSIYPNPAVEYITLQVDVYPNIHYKIYNASGSLIDSGRILSNTLYVANLHPGVYFIELISAEGIGNNCKFVKL